MVLRAEDKVKRGFEMRQSDHCFRIDKFSQRCCHGSKHQKAVGSAEKCAVCICEFEDDELVLVTRCGHVFHPGCMQQCMTKGLKNMTCPACRSEDPVLGIWKPTPKPKVEGKEVEVDW